MSVGHRGWTGVGGAAPIHFRTVKDHRLPSHSVTYYYPITDILCISMSDSLKKTLLDVWSWHHSHTRALYKPTHTLFIRNTLHT